MYHFQNVPTYVLERRGAISFGCPASPKQTEPKHHGPRLSVSIDLLKGYMVQLFV